MDFMYDGKKMELKSSRFANYNKIYRGYYDFNKQGENKMAGLENYTITTGPLIGNWNAGALPTVTPTNRRQVKIDKVANGFIVEIGCKKFVAGDWISLASKLGEYWADPVKAEKKYCK